MKLNDLRKLIREEIKNEKAIKESNGIERKIQDQINDLEYFLGVKELPINVNDIKSKLSESKSKDFKDLKEVSEIVTDQDVMIAILLVAGIFSSAVGFTYGPQVIEWLRTKLKK
jgi:hypothetical protein